MSASGGESYGKKGRLRVSRRERESNLEDDDEDFEEQDGTEDVELDADQMEAAL
jgi:hypothetical protein